MSNSSQSQPCGEASADAEVFAGLDVERAAASIAALVDEYTQRGWNDEGRAKFAATIARRLRRFVGPPPEVQLALNECWRAVDALGGQNVSGSDYDDGFIDALVCATKEIENLGGKWS